MSILCSPLRRTAMAAAGALAAAAVLTACGDPPSMPVTGPQGKPDVLVTTVTPQPLTLSTEMPGRIVPMQVAEVRPQVGGLILGRDFVEGAMVKEGQTLYRIDPSTYRAAVASAEAALAKAEANLKVARIKSQRLNELADMKAAGQQDADDAAASELQAQADVASARAKLQTELINLHYTAVQAPISGRIGRSAITQGALVTASQATALATVQKLDPIFVDVTQTSSQMLSLKQALATGQLRNGTTTVKLILENGSPYPLEGRLQASEVTVDQSTGSVTLRAEFPNPKGLLLPGMYVRAVVEEGQLPEALLVPQPAVSRDATGLPIVHVLTAEDKLEKCRVQTARAVGDRWLISSGLSAGDRVVVEGQDKVPAGAVVNTRALAETPVKTSQAPQAAPVVR